VYGPVWPHVLSPASARARGSAGNNRRLGRVCVRVFRDLLSVPVGELEELRGTELWAPILADAPASLGDVRRSLPVCAQT
jgi:hypothetical protein